LRGNKFYAQVDQNIYLDIYYRPNGM
jgi:hypothetical protein